MPIILDKKTKTWELQEPDKEEKELLLETAKNHIIEIFGETLADAIMRRVAGSFDPEIDLKNIPTKNMFNS